MRTTEAQQNGHEQQANEVKTRRACSREGTAADPRVRRGEMDWAELAQEETEQLEPFTDDPRERPGGFQSVKPSQATEEWLEDIKDEESVDSRAGSSAERQ